MKRHLFLLLVPLLLVFGLGTDAEAQYAHVQSVFQHITTGAPSKTFESNNTAGNAIIVACSYASITPPTISDTRNTYTLIRSTLYPDVAQSTVWAAFTIGSGANTVTFSNFTEAMDCVFHEYSGITAVDQDAGDYGDGSTPDSGNTATTTSANELVYGLIVSQNDSGVGSGFTARIDTAFDMYDVAEDKRVTSTGQYSATGASTAGWWIATVVTFTEGGGGSATVPDPPTIGTATAGVQSASVAFTPPADNGGSTILYYTATTATGGGGVDLSEYRTATYGTPDHYCDDTKSASGDGTSGNPWSITQCMSEPVAGEVIGHLNTGTGTPIDLTAPNSRLYAAFRPANEGSWNGSSCTSRIVHVTRYPAISLDYSTITTNPNRTELRHAGTDDYVDGGGNDVQGTGGAAYGVYGTDCITYDGFFVDMAQIGFRNDAGVINAWLSNGVEFKNFVIKGKTTDCDNNCGLIRTEDTIDTLFENYTIRDYHNAPTGGGLNQAGETSIHYGARNIRHRHFSLINVDRGLFLKGTAPSGVNYNWGTIEYGLIINTAICLTFHALDASNVTTVRYNLCYSVVPTADTASGALVFDSITMPGRNVNIHHNTFAKVDASFNSMGCFIVQDYGLDPSSSNNVTWQDNICDMDSGSYAHEVELLTTVPQVMDYNGYIKGNGAESYVYNGVQYGPSQNGNFSGFQTATSRESNSAELATSPFVDRANNDFHVANGHAAKTMSSTNGEIGAYGAGSEAIGPITSGGGSGTISASGASSPIVVTGLTAGQSYTFTVTATNSVGTSDPSAESNAVIPTTAGTGTPEVRQSGVVLRASGDAVALSLTNVQGNMLIVCAGWLAASTAVMPTIEDDTHNTYSLVAAQSNGTNTVGCWTAANIVSGTNAFRVSRTTGQLIDIAYAEYSNLELVDRSITAYGTTTGAATYTTANMAATQWLNEVILGFTITGSTDNAAGAGFTSITNGVGNTWNRIEARTVSVGGTYPVSFSSAGATTWLSIGLALKVTGSAPVSGGGTGEGGIFEHDYDDAQRPALNGTQAGVPSSRGPFTFVAPYGTQAYRITDATDCNAGVDCIMGGIYPYWSMINNSSANPNTLYVVVGLQKSGGGHGVTLFSVNKLTNAVTKIGPLFADSDSLSDWSGEGWYFSKQASAPTTFYVNDRNSMWRVNVTDANPSATKSLVFNIDSTAAQTAFGSNRYFWQPSSSRDDHVHAFTVRDDATEAMLGCGVYFEAGNLAGRAAGSFRYYPEANNINECHVDASGLYLVIIDDQDGVFQEDARVYDLSDDSNWWIMATDGGPGHYDVGWQYMLGADDVGTLPEWRLWDLSTGTVTGNGTIVYQDPTWAAASVNHTSWNNSDSTTPIAQQYACGSYNQDRGYGRGVEITCYRLDGSHDVMVVAPDMIDRSTNSQGGVDYYQWPKANISGDGQYVAWISNLRTDYSTIIVVKLPAWTQGPPTSTAHLTLAITVVNDDGGTSGSTAWTLSATGPETISGAGGVSDDVLVGTYTLAATSVLGYSLSGWSCTAGTLIGNSLTLTTNQISTCTIVANDIPATTAAITVINHVINDDGGTATANNWTITVSATTPVPSVFPGAESPGTLVQVGLGGFSITAANGPITYTQTGASGCTGTALGGRSYTCTFTWNDNPTGPGTDTPATPYNPAVNVIANRFLLNTAELWSGAGNPTDVITGNVGSQWLRTDTGSLYTKTATGTAGWKEIYRQAGTDVAVADGGTGRSSWTIGQLLYASGTDVISGLYPVALGQVLASNGTNAAPVYTGAPYVSSIGQLGWVSQTSGWMITSQGWGDFRALFADQLHVRLFIADLEQALAGSQRIAKSVSSLQSPMTCPSGGSYSQMSVKDLPGSPNVHVFAANDMVAVRNYSRGTGLDIADCVGTVTSPDTSPDGYQNWIFTRASGANGGTLAAGATVARDTIVIDYGVSGDGYYEVNAVDPSNTSIRSVPYAQIVTWANSPIQENTTTRARFGNLYGITSQNGEYGMIAGTYSGYTEDSAYFRASNLAVEMVGIDMLMYDPDVGGGPVFRVARNAGNPYLSLGAPAPTSVGSGTGIFMGGDGSGGYDFRVGNPSGQNMLWDASAGTLAITGSITATTGTIGGWTLGTSTLTGGDVTLNSAGYIIAGSGNNVATMDGRSSNSIRFWAGHADAAQAPFTVSQAGAVTATSIDLSTGQVSWDSTGITIVPNTDDIFDTDNAYRFSVSNGTLGSGAWDWDASGTRTRGIVIESTYSPANAHVSTASLRSYSDGYGNFAGVNATTTSAAATIQLYTTTNSTGTYQGTIAIGGYEDFLPDAVTAASSSGSLTLPSNVCGYIVAAYQGTQIRIPFYAQSGQSCPTVP